MSLSHVVRAPFLGILVMIGPVFAADWKPLFNGKDLSGWKAIDGPLTSWHAEDGILYCSGEGSGWLSTDLEYANFELELEFRVPPGGNSGVFLRAPHRGNPAFDCVEIQILDDYSPDFANIKPAQYSGSLYDVVAAQPRASKRAGEWQTMNIVCDGDHLKVTLNGTKIIDTDLDAHPDKLATHPGLKNKKGYIGLQNHSSRLDFRNVRVREL